MLEHATGEQEVHLRQEKARLSSLITATEEAVNRIILEIRTQNDREITELTTYLAALDRVAKGMPRQLVEKPFPPFPSPGVKQKTL
jgi:hypothetical protein